MHHRCAEWANTICTYWSFSLLQLMSEKPLLNRFYGDFDVIEFYEFSLYFTLYRCMAIIQQHLPASRRVFRDIIHHVPNFIHCHLNRMNEANKLNGWVKEAVLTMNGKIPIVRNLIFGLVEVDCLTNWAHWTEKTFNITRELKLKDFLQVYIFSLLHRQHQSNVVYMLLWDLMSVAIKILWPNVTYW